jgi:hypothetical protein
MIDDQDEDLPNGLRWITWEIGQSELQKSVMAVETFEYLRSGITNVDAIRAKICQKRKLATKRSTGDWIKTPSDRFVNEHAWVLAMMNQYEMIEDVNRRTRTTALKPGASKELLSAVVDFFQRNEPFEWQPQPGLYKRAPSLWR